MAPGDQDPPGRMRRLAPGLVDAIVAALLVVAAVISVRTTGEDLAVMGLRPYDGVGLGLLVVHQGLVAVRRRHPIAVLSVATALFVTLRVMGYPSLGVDGVALLLCFYSAGAHGSPGRPQRVIALTAVLVAAVAAAIIGGGLTPDAVVGLSAVYTAVYAVGNLVQRLRAQALLLAGEVERAREHYTYRVRQAVFDERKHIARELHDIVAHSLAFIVAEAEAGSRVFAQQPERARDALETVGSAGRSGLRDMRRLLLVLHVDDRDSHADGALAPQPGLCDLDGLVHTVRSAGLEVRLTTRGDLAGLTPAIELSAYRIVQEALTNVLKHAGPVGTFVDVSHEDDVLSIEVIDSGSAPGAAAGRSVEPGSDVPTAGEVPHGLLGLRERAALFGGRLEAGPVPGGGWRVAAALPTDRERNLVSSTVPGVTR